MSRVYSAAVRAVSLPLGNSIPVPEAIDSDTVPAYCIGYGCNVCANIEKKFTRLFYLLPLITLRGE